MTNPPEMFSFFKPKKTQSRSSESPVKEETLLEDTLEDNQVKSVSSASSDTDSYPSYLTQAPLKKKRENSPSIVSPPPLKKKKKVNNTTTINVTDTAGTVLPGATPASAPLGELLELPLYQPEEESLLLGGGGSRAGPRVLVPGWTVFLKQGLYQGPSQHPLQCSVGLQAGNP